MNKITIFVGVLLPFWLASCAVAPGKLPQRFHSADRQTILVFHTDGRLDLEQRSEPPIIFDIGRWTISADIVEIHSLDEVLRFRIKRTTQATILEGVNLELCPKIISTWRLSAYYEAEAPKN